MLAKNNTVQILIFFIFTAFWAETLTAGEAKDEEGYTLRSCTRKFSTTPSLAAGDCLDHCYVQLVRGKKISYSRGFFADTGPIEEPGMFDGFQTCLTVRKGLTLDDWAKVTAVYDRYTAEDYRPATRNCCSVAYEAIAAVVGKAQVPQNILTANSSIGTCHLRGFPLSPSA